MTAATALAPARLPTEAAASRRGAALPLVGAAVGLMLLAEAPLLWKFFLDLWSRPQYEFFPLLLLALPFVAVACLRDLPAADLTPGRVSVGLMFWTAAWVCLMAGGVIYARWFAPVSTWLLVAGAVWLIGGRRLATAVWPVGVLALLVLPPPAQYDQDLLVALRHAAVVSAGSLLETLRVPMYLHGAVIDVPGDRLMVEEACSGINSMLAVLAFTVLLAFWKRLPLLALLLLLPAAFAFVFWANVMRITLCAAAKVWYGVDLLTGAPHELLGLLLFVTSMALVFSTERLGQRWFDWEDGQTPTPPAPSASAARAARPVLWLVAAAVFMASGGFVTARTWHAWPESILPTADALRMPAALAGWTRVDDKDAGPERAEVSGRQSRLWQYRRGDLLATVGVDYPFAGYHDATNCYRLAGWQVTDTLERGPGAGGPARFEVAMHRPPLSYGLMTFSLCDESGQWWQRPPSPGAESFLLHKLRLSRKTALSRPSAQLQVLRVDFRPSTDAERAQVSLLFDAAAEALATQIKGLAAAAGAMTPPRILFVDHTARMGGGEVALLNLVLALDRARYTPVVLLFADGPLRHKLCDAGVETHVLPLAADVAETRKDAIGGTTLLHGRTVMRTLAFVWKVRGLIRRLRPAIVHTNSLKADIIGGLAGRLARRPVIWHVRDRIADDYLPPRVVKAFRWLAGYVPRIVIANSRATLETLDKGTPGVAIPSGTIERADQSSYQVIHDGTPPGDDTPAVVAGGGGALRVGLVGRLARWKGQHVFIEAARQLAPRFPRATFRIIGSALFGEDDYERELRDTVDREGLRQTVEFAGFREDVSAAIAELDVLVHASITGEPFGQVIIEGMTAAKPVVATRGGGVPEIVVDNDTGLLVPMDDADAMAGAIGRLLEDPALRTRMGRRGRQRVADHFTIRHTAEKVQRVYDELLQPRGPSQSH